MIAITATIHPHDSSPLLQLVRHRFRRFESPLQLVADSECMPFLGLRWQLLARHRDGAVALVLAGSPESFELNTPQTGVRTAFKHIFAGTGSGIRTRYLHCESIR
jgi:hypothetical protein